MYLMDLTDDEIRVLLQSWSAPAYRARQVAQWLRRGVRPADMTNLPVQLREQLANIPFGGSNIERCIRSAVDDTEKYLFLLEDGNLVEGVLMHNRYGTTACISTQVGCRMGCKFCASTLSGCVRNLRRGEMLSFLTELSCAVGETNGHRAVTNVVLMGSGEPLDNFDELQAFLQRAISPDGLGISVRNISLSTCGIVPMIDRLIQEGPHVTLCISLHAHEDDMRTALMPINSVYPLGVLLPAARRYAEQTGRRVIFEYALVSGVNASEQDAAALSRLLKGINCHVNLIPLNSVKERNLDGVNRVDAYRFADWLTSNHISATVRREMGADIEGACGQLRRRVLNENSMDQ